MSEPAPGPSLPYGRQSIGDDDAAAVAEALRSDFLTTGPRVQTFERLLAAAAGVPHAVAVNSGTAALHAAYFAAGLGRDDEIVTSPLTFAATANAALYLGASVRFADVQADTGNLDPDAAAAALSPRAKLVVPVDFGGHPADYDELAAVARRHGVRVIADACHSLGAAYRGRPCGSLAHASAFSFHPVKPVTTAEGGAIVTADAALAAAAARFRSHGVERDPAAMPEAEGPWWYEQRELGFNYRLTDLQCALGVSQMAKLGRFIARRRAIAARYRDGLAGVAGIELPAPRPYVEPGWHLLIVRVREAARRRAFFDRLRQLGLGVQVHYIPVYFHPFYRDLGFKRGLCPVAEDLYARSVSLPIYPAMSDADADSAIERVRRAAKELL